MPINQKKCKRKTGKMRKSVRGTNKKLNKTHKRRRNIKGGMNTGIGSSDSSFGLYTKRKPTSSTTSVPVNNHIPSFDKMTVSTSKTPPAHGIKDERKYFNSISDDDDKRYNSR